MIDISRVRELDIADHHGNRGFVSAASGLVRAGDHFHVVADDLLHLASFPVQGNGPGYLTRLLDGELPAGAKERKKLKPDFEALLALQRGEPHRFGALLALGSGSTERRMHGVMLPLKADGSVDTDPAARQLLDLAPLYASFARRFRQTNIEGAIAMDGALMLFQRGNMTEPVNAILRFALEETLRALYCGAAIAPPQITSVELGECAGVPFTFTDACVCEGTILFSAVAENTGNAYDDGAVSGAAIGAMTAQGKVLWLEDLSQPVKIEGMEAQRTPQGFALAMVSDADDPRVAAGLLRAEISGERWMK